ncbi:MULTISPECIES: hypothetical protein [Bacteroidales]|jgi:hypothetical protein|uniref:hypothetical protein n=1 Tax=Bacteroidales TaxID=171549 RepID=UPI0025B7316A|nr:MULTISPECIES: hypothetical protein [Bacteroidales]
MSNARIKKTGEIKAFYPTTQSGYKGYVDTDGRFYYPEQLDFQNGGRIVGPNGETLNIQEVREYMISSLDNIIEKLYRNKSILQDGGVLENEHWADIAVAFREATYYFANQQFYKHEK